MISCHQQPVTDAVNDVSNFQLTSFINLIFAIGVVVSLLRQPKYSTCKILNTLFYKDEAHRFFVLNKGMPGLSFIIVERKRNLITERITIDSVYAGHDFRER